MFLPSLRLAVLALGVIISIGAAASPAIGGTADDITLTGCLIRGEDGGYLLTNGPSAPAWRSSCTATAPMSSSSSR